MIALQLMRTQFPKLDKVFCVLGNITFSPLRSLINRNMFQFIGLYVLQSLLTLFSTWNAVGVCVCGGG